VALPAQVAAEAGGGARHLHVVRTQRGFALGEVAPQQRLRLGEPALLLQRHRPMLHGFDRHLVVGTDLARGDGRRALQQGHRVAGAAGTAQDIGELAQVDRDFESVRAQLALGARERASLQRLRFGVAMLVHQVMRQPVAALARQRMVRDPAGPRRSPGRVGAGARLRFPAPRRTAHRTAPTAAGR
jgi:hypothetical protein